MAYEDQDGNLVVRAETATVWHERAERAEVEVDRLRDALWAIVMETSNDPQRIKDAAREAIAFTTGEENKR